MDFELSPEQVALAESARDLLAGRWRPDVARTAIDLPPVLLPDELWKQIADLGWIGLAAPEDVGGSGADVMTACVIAIEAGRALLPTTLASVTAAAVALDRSGGALRAALLPAILSGGARAVCAVEEPGGSWGPDSVGAEATPAGDGWSLSGTKILVPDTEGADTLLVAARTPHGLGLLAVPVESDGIVLTPMRRLDAQSIAEVRFTNTPVGPESLLGGPEACEALLRQTYDVWTVLCAADMLGAAEAVLEATTRYAKERVQFDRPIGSFQAVAHRLADVLVDCEIARSLVYAACLAIDERRDNSSMMVSAAKAWAGDIAVSAAETAVKLHGGIGFTWEMDLHLYLRRVRASAASLGGSDFHRDRIAETLVGAGDTGEGG